MQALKTAWDFVQTEVLGMQWLNRLMGSIVEALGLDPTSRIGGSVQFFFYDVIKIMILLGFLILMISYIQSYFPPERTKRILGRFHGIGANCVAALLLLVHSVVYRLYQCRPSSGCNLLFPDFFPDG